MIFIFVEPFSNVAHNKANDNQTFDLERSRMHTGFTRFQFPMFNLRQVIIYIVVDCRFENNIKRAKTHFTQLEWGLLNRFPQFRYHQRYLVLIRYQLLMEYHTQF